MAAVGVVGRRHPVQAPTKGSDDRDPGGPSGGHAGAMLSALFLLVFAIAIIVPWTTADTARQNTYAESQAAVETYWAAAGLPRPSRPSCGPGCATTSTSWSTPSGR